MAPFVWTAIVLSLMLQAGGAAPAAPAMPYEDIGACPFECCQYREWTATERVTLFKERRPNSGVAFVTQSSEKVGAITGVVITKRPGRARVDSAADLSANGAPLHIEPWETLFLLTYRGEGHYLTWFKGRFHDHVDAVIFAGVNGACDTRPERCNGRVIEKPDSEWWVQIRNSKGVSGWTREPQKFSNKDACG